MAKPRAEIFNVFEWFYLLYLKLYMIFFSYHELLIDVQ